MCSMARRAARWWATWPLSALGKFPAALLLYWAYQILAVALLAAASMTAFQDLQATAWRDVAIGEIPEIVVYRNPQGTFTRSVTAGFIVAVLIQFLVRGQTSLAMPYYGVGVFMPIMVMGLAIRQHMLHNYTGKSPHLGSGGRDVCGCPGRVGLCRPDRRQVERRRLGGADLVQHSGPRRQCAVDFAHRLPRSAADSPHRPRKGARAGRDGLHRRMAIAQDAGIPLSHARWHRALFRTVRRAPPGALRAAAAGRGVRRGAPRGPSRSATRFSINISTASPSPSRAWAGNRAKPPSQSRRSRM